MAALAHNKNADREVEPETVAQSPPRTPGAIVLRILREPLAHFIVAGFALFIAGRIYHNETSTYRIIITPQHVAELANQYSLKFGAKPDPATLEDLIKHDIHDEILYRQGLALNLDKDDQIVRRRIVQKTQFLIQDLDAPPEPTNTELQAWYKVHADNYVTPPRATFTHIFFSADKGGDNEARRRAAAVLKSLQKTTANRAPDKGDPFPDLYDFSAYEPEQVQRVFGKTPFSKAVFNAPVGHWSGPFRSGYGWHLLYIDARKPPVQPPLSAVRDAVRTDYLESIQNRTNKAAFDKLASRFTIIREDQGAAP